MLKNYCFHIKALRYVSNMQSINIAEGKLRPNIVNAPYSYQYFSAVT